MEINKLNVAQIVTMKSHIDSVSRDYKYFEERRVFLFWKKKAGFYDVSWYSEQPFITEEAIVAKNRNLFCKDKKVYHKPYLEFRMSNGSFDFKVFESKEELEKFVKNSSLAQVNWIDK